MAARTFAVAAAVALLVPAIAAQSANPRFGRWKLKSDNPASTNIMTYEPFNGTGMKVTV